jgi:hypothetical protein
MSSVIVTILPLGKDFLVWERETLRGTSRFVYIYIAKLVKVKTT